MISVTVLTKNSEELIRRCLEALKSFDEVVVLDNGSTDKTIEIASSFKNVKVFKSPFIGFGPLKNVAASKASHDWILSIDVDEVLKEKTLIEIKELLLDPKCVYSFPRENRFIGKTIKASGWSPDRVLRLYNRANTSYSNAMVHESVEIKGMGVVSLKGALEHDSYRHVGDLLTKMQHYSTLFAEENKGRKRSSLFKAIVHAKFAFFKTYFLKWGFLDGVEGYVIAKYNADTAYYKYLKLHYAQVVRVNSSGLL